MWRETESQLGHKGYNHYTYQKAREPGYDHQPQTPPGSHQERVAERVADGQVAIICHDSYRSTQQWLKNQQDKELEQATSQRWLPLQEALQHFGHHWGSVEDLQEGQISQEEIHGCVELWELTTATMISMKFPKMMDA